MHYNVSKANHVFALIQYYTRARLLWLRTRICTINQQSDFPYPATLHHVTGLPKFKLVLSQNWSLGTKIFSSEPVTSQFLGKFHSIFKELSFSFYFEHFTQVLREFHAILKRIPRIFETISRNF